MDAIEKLKMSTDNKGLRKNLGICYQCGMCTGGCPVAHARPDYNPRRILETLILGQYDELLSSPLIWLCLSCNSCMQRCPQRIEITELFVDLKNAAAESRRIPEPLFERAKRIAETGRSTPNSKASLVWREKLGLAPPNDVNVEEVRVLLESVKFLGSLERRRNGLDGASS